MTRVSEIAEHWFGLCRKPPAVTCTANGYRYPDGTCLGRAA